MTKFLLAGSSLLIVEEIINGIQSFFFKICILIDGVVYNMINVCYQIFLLLSRVRIFDDNVFSGFLNRFYVLVGVLTLFFVAYSLLKVIANPDNMTKGNMAPGKLIMNIITSIALIALLPAIFNAAYKVQDVVIDSNIIGKIIFDNATDVDIDSDSDNVVKKGGRQIASTLWGAFFYTDDGVSEDNILSPDGKSLTLARDEFASGARGFNVFTEFSSNAALSEGEPGKIHYRFFLSAIAGAFALYVVFSFVFDLGIRAVKLAILQIIAPLPILMRIIPGRDGAFKKWTSITIGTFVEVIVRIFVVYMIAFLAGRVSDIWSSLTSGLNVSGPVSAMAKAFILMGIIAFAKQAPKMISDILGIKAGDMKLGGIRDKLREGGGFVAGGAIGAGVTAGVRNGYNAGKNIAGAEGWKNKAKAIAKGVGSVAAGTASGALRGGFEARNAKTYADVAAAAGKGAAGAAAARENREKHPLLDFSSGKPRLARDENGKITGGTMGARARNFARGFQNWATGETNEALKKKSGLVSSITSSAGKVTDAIKNDLESNLDKVIVRDKNGNIVTDDYGKAKTLGSLKRRVDSLKNEFDSLNEDNYVSKRVEEFKVKYRALSGGVEPSATDVDQMFEAAKAEFPNVKNQLEQQLRSAAKEYSDAVDNDVHFQFLFEKTGNVDYAVKLKDGTDSVTFAVDGSASIDVKDILRVANVSGAGGLISDMNRVIKDNALAVSNDINKMLSDLQKTYDEGIAAGTLTEIEIKDMQSKFENLQRVLTNIKNPELNEFVPRKLDGTTGSAVRIDSKSLKSAYGVLSTAIENEIKERRIKEEKDKK